MRKEVNGVDLESRRDSQQWILDWVIKQTGREQNFEYEDRKFPPEVKSHAMIPRAMHKLGAHCERIARAAEERGHYKTARLMYFKASQHYANGQHAIPEDDNDDKIFLNERLRACYDKVIQFADTTMERVEVPWEGVSLEGIFFGAPGEGRKPAVLYIPGMDDTKEMHANPDSNAFLERGMNVLVLDGPGQGASNIRKIRVTADNYERAGSAAITYLSGRPEVDPEKIAVAGNSMGSYWTQRIASYDPRVKATASGAANYGGKRQIFEQASPRFKQVFMYMAGIHDEEEFNRMAAQMHLMGYGAKTRCACLLTAGDYDPLAPLDDILAYFEELAGPKELWIFESDFHSSGRERSGKPNLGGTSIFPFVADWLAEALEGRLPKDLNRRLLVPVRSGEGPYGAPTEDFRLRSRHPRTAV